MKKKHEPAGPSRVMLDPVVADQLRDAARDAGMYLSPFVKLCLAAYREKETSPSIRPGKTPESTHTAAPEAAATTVAPATVAAQAVGDINGGNPSSLGEVWIGETKPNPATLAEILGAEQALRDAPGKTVVDLLATEARPPRERLIMSYPTLLSRVADQLPRAADRLPGLDPDHEVALAVAQHASAMVTPEPESLDVAVLGAAWDVAASRRGCEQRAEEDMAAALEQIYRIALTEMAHGDADMALNVVMHWFDTSIAEGDVDPRLLAKTLLSTEGQSKYFGTLPDLDMPAWTAEAIVAEAMEL